MPAGPAHQPHAAAPPVVRPWVVVYGLGGTIAMTATDTGGMAPALSAHQLIAAVPGLAAAGADIDVVDFRNKPGASLTVGELTHLAARIRDRLDGGATGAVVTQGTDTIEETAYLLDLLHHRPGPIVVTGAMRNPTLSGADGPANLLAAVQVAASRQARDLGCLVVANDEVHAAARVRKTHSTSTATFASPNGGPLGYLVEGSPRLLSRAVDRYTVTGALDQREPRVGLYAASLGDDGAALSAYAAGFDGLVIAGFGVGRVPATWIPALADLADHIPVVLASRTGAGPVLTATYGFDGSERDLVGRGLIPAGWLDPYKARILLLLMLATGADRDSIAAAFGHAAGDGSTP